MPKKIKDRIEMSNIPKDQPSKTRKALNIMVVGSKSLKIQVTYLLKYLDKEIIVRIPEKADYSDYSGLR